MRAAHPLPEGKTAVADRSQLTTTAGNPIADNQNSIGAGNWGLIGNNTQKSQ
jgi:catalase